MRHCRVPGTIQVIHVGTHQDREVIYKLLSDGNERGHHLLETKPLHSTYMQMFDTIRPQFPSLLA